MGSIGFCDPWDHVFSQHFDIHFAIHPQAVFDEEHGGRAAALHGVGPYGCPHHEASGLLAPKLDLAVFKITLVGCVDSIILYFADSLLSEFYSSVQMLLFRPARSISANIFFPPSSHFFLEGCCY